MTMTLANVAAYSLQFGVLALAALIAAALLRLRTPRPALRFWQAIAAASIALPLLQPTRDGDPFGAAFSFVANSAPAPFTVLRTSTIDIASWLLYLVAAGIAIKLAWLAIGLLRLGVISKRATPTRALDGLLHEHSRATIAISDDVETPATIGIIRPLILVPPRLLTMPEPVQRAVIIHEVIHVRRRDWLHTIVEECWCALLWFHPAARLIASRLSLARETVVDEAAILITQDRRAYALALLAFANPQPKLPGVIALIGRRQLSQRISLIAEEAVMTRHRAIVSFVVALFISGTAASAAVSRFPITRHGDQSVVYEPGNGVTLPVVVHEVKPKYTAAAMQQRIQGSVFLHVVIGETGDVTNVTVTESLDREYGLDDEAVRAAWQWKFKPGTKDGKPVPVRVTVQLTFTLKK